MNNKEFGLQLEKRTKQLAISILKLTSQLPDNPEANVVRYQLAKAGTSVGANYREANFEEVPRVLGVPKVSKVLSRK